MVIPDLKHGILTGAFPRFPYFVLYYNGISRIGVVRVNKTHCCAEETARQPRVFFMRDILRIFEL